MERARPARPDDTARLIELCDEALAEVSSRRGGRQLAYSVLAGHSVPARLALALADPDEQVIAGELSGALLGVGLIRRDPLAAGNVAAVEVLFVDPGARGVGLGESMMDAMTEWAIGHGCRGIDAMALPGSREAKAFFETHGLVARALVMHRELPLGPSAGGRT
ncbi:GNAT family N-acetyltransferase [Acidiferrimicrobium sp. IK]|uniref:GNAT family N-acetyltransferase n=1 Tax=Acidiferrimicrobium sp. IK TaxID=2871700 RepID=UPI0021CB7F2A|nr:GNAT family N-acetyltransferase [Acidiferrimicrobium sp. IK]MCU4184679.1 GNAT family N-acetyltransferase [Acidiferrimicrobium sp. IK]